MKVGNLGGRLVLIEGDLALDVHQASNGAFGPDPQQAFDDWDSFVAAASSFDRKELRTFDRRELRCPSPSPRQVLAVGLNYASHAEETGLALPEVPAIFTKFPSCLEGPEGEVTLTGPTVDWEVELVAVIGRRASGVEERDAWAYVAGLCVGQDLSDRTLQFAAGAQFSLGKSAPGFGPVGPWITTPDEVHDLNDLELGCSVNGVTVQSDRTSGLVFSVSRLIKELSAILPLLPGDLLFTGTPAGVGMVANPPRFLAEGDVLESWVEGLGTLRTVAREA